MEVTDVIKFHNISAIKTRFPLVGAALEEIFEMENSDNCIHGDSKEVKNAVNHCLRLKGSHIPNFEDELDEFMRNYRIYTFSTRSIFAEHMINCCEGDIEDECDTQPFEYDE